MSRMHCKRDVREHELDTRVAFLLWNLHAAVAFAGGDEVRASQ